MGELYYPFATGPGAFASEGDWTNIFLMMGRPGVLPGYGNQFSISAPGGAFIQVDTGRAHCLGHYYELTSLSDPIAIAANAGATRYDRVVIRFDFSGGDAAHVTVLPGPGGGTLPTLSADLLGFYDLPLGVVAVPTGASIVSSAISMALDRWALPLNLFPAGTLLPMTAPLATYPAWALPPDGASVKRLNFERLWDAYASLTYDPANNKFWGQVHGANPAADTIKLPDLRGRSFIGLDNQGGPNGNGGRLAAPDQLGNIVGSNVLDSARVPPHYHPLLPDSTTGGDANSLVPFVYQRFGLYGLLSHTDPSSVFTVGVAPLNQLFADYNIPPGSDGDARTEYGPNYVAGASTQADDSNVPSSVMGYWMLMT